MAERQLTSPSKSFENLKQVDTDGIEYWTARALMMELEYTSWADFQKVIQKAQQASMNSGEPVGNHFVGKSGGIREYDGSAEAAVDWKLDRYACYLIAQNSDPTKKPVAEAQTYFAVQTRGQEKFQGLRDSARRLLMREEAKGQNIRLNSTAKNAGVSNFGIFHDAGYRGLYGMSTAEVERQKRIKKGTLLDHAGATELAANLFRITQTEEKLRADGFVGQGRATETHEMVGKKVRDTIRKIGGKMPENLLPETHINEVMKELKKTGTYDDIIKRVTSRTAPPVKRLLKKRRGKR